MNFSGVFKKFFKILTQEPSVGGLEISESVLRFAIIKEGKVSVASLRLPPEILVSGEVKNPEQFKEALNALYKQTVFSQEKGKVNVVVSLPFSRAYVQTFKLPPIAEKGITGAAELNMQMISPLPVGTAYYDWERIGDSEAEGGGLKQMEFLGAFAMTKEVNSFLSVLKNSLFNVVAVEFSSFALTRFAVLGAAGFDPHGSYIILNLSGGETEFIIVKNSFLYFSYSVSLNLSSVGVASVQVVLERSLQQVFNFYVNRWGNDFNGIFIVSDLPKLEVESLFREKFSISPVYLTPKVFTELSPSWFVVAGLALRGQIARSRDTMISLAPVGTEEEYKNVQLSAFVRFWRSVAVSSLSFLILIFLISNLFLKSVLGEIKKEDSAGFNSTEVSAEVVKLKTEAKEFNNLTAVVKEAYKNKSSWDGFLEKLNTIAGPNVKIKRIFVAAVNQPVLVRGEGSDEKSVVDFKSRLEKDGEFSDIKLPLSDLSYVSGKVSFNLNFSIKSAAVK